MTEQEAIQALTKGSIDAIEVLIKLHEKRVYNAVLNIVQKIEDAEEITQDVFVKTINNISSFKGESTFGTWIYRVAVNEALTHLRKQKTKKRWDWLKAVFGGIPDEHGPPHFDHPEALLEQKQTTAEIFAAIGKLPERQKVAFTLRHIEQLGQKDIATIMELKEGAVESLIQRAKQTLKTILTNKTR